MDYPPQGDLSSKTLVFDAEGGLLKSSSTFPYFMLVALEAGGYLRGLLLLLLYPLICFLGQDMGLRVMVMVCFFGMKKGKFTAGKAVLPKWLLEDVGLEGFEVLRKGGRRVCVTCMPRIMVEAFLKEYLEVEVVVGRELKTFRGYYNGLMVEEIKVVKELLSGEVLHVDDSFLGVLSSFTRPQNNPLFDYCKEVYIVNDLEKKKWRNLPRDKYPKPLIFHDGRLAFRPTAASTLAMFMWLPFGFLLAILKLLATNFLPPRGISAVSISVPLSGLRWRYKGINPCSKYSGDAAGKGHLYVCNHRSLLDSVYIALALNKPVVSLAYSVSKLSEFVAPVEVATLSRNREKDRKKIEDLLSRGKRIVIMPEGTTCREPFLLRFSPLFTELADKIIPVTLSLQVGMFYATTAGGMKAMDPVFFLMNPSACYELEFLEEIDTSSVIQGKVSNIDMANQVQQVMGRALGFQCTMLTRKDKYRMLAGNDGVVNAEKKPDEKTT